MEINSSGMQRQEEKKLKMWAKSIMKYLIYVSHIIRFAY